jgi:hypothetical protein
MAEARASRRDHLKMLVIEAIKAVVFYPIGNRGATEALDRSIQSARISVSVRNPAYRTGMLDVALRGF